MSRKWDDRIIAGQAAGLDRLRAACGASEPFRRIQGVYALADPRTGRVMYVGQSIDVDYRFRQHCDPMSHDRNLGKRRWIEELRFLGMTPDLRVLDECDWWSIDDTERRRIAEFKACGQAEFNVAVGGRGRATSRVANGHLDDWYQVGLKIKRARKLLYEIADDLCRLGGAKLHDKALKVVLGLDRVKWDCEGIVSHRFPEMHSVSRLFSGDDESEPKS